LGLFKIFHSVVMLSKVGEPLHPPLISNLRSTGSITVQLAAASPRRSKAWQDGWWVDPFN